jgi:D-methionine transport system ATP-binding protein
MDNLDSFDSGFNQLDSLNHSQGSQADDRNSTSPQLQLKQVGLVTSGGKTITGIPILTDISFEVDRSDRLAIIGPSGAGKTSLLRLLNRLTEPTTGAIALENQDYRKTPVLELRRQVMLVPQEPKLLGMTGQEAITYPLRLQQLPQREIQQRLDACREELHIPADWLERTELQLSVGQRQLIAIARALIIQPKILLLDEPTSALDAGTGSHVLNFLANLAVEGKVTIIMVNHQLDMAQLFCTRVLYLQDGQLLQDAPSEQINWQQLRERLVQAEAEMSQDWS